MLLSVCACIYVCVCLCVRMHAQVHQMCVCVHNDDMVCPGTEVHPTAGHSRPGDGLEGV